MSGRELVGPAALLVVAWATLAPGRDGQNALQRRGSALAPPRPASKAAIEAPAAYPAPGAELPAPTAPFPTQPLGRAD